MTTTETLLTIGLMVSGWVNWYSLIDMWASRARVRIYKRSYDKMSALLDESHAARAELLASRNRHKADLYIIGYGGKPHVNKGN